MGESTLPVEHPVPADFISVLLTDSELVLLDGGCRPEVQKIVDVSKQRLAARQRYSQLAPALAAFIADVVAEAHTQGRLIYNNRTRIRRCNLCGRLAGYYIYRSGRQRGKPDYNRPLHLAGVELAHRTVRVEGSVQLGGCTDCIDQVRLLLVDALADIEVQLPGPLVKKGQPLWVWNANRHCTNCGWDGHEGQMGRLNTLMNDGTYPAICPSCGMANEPLRRVLIAPAEGFTMTRAPAK